MKHLGFVCCLLAVLVSTAAVQADMTVTVEEVGADLVVSYSGSIDLSLMGYLGSGAVPGSFASVDPDRNSIFNYLNGGTLDAYQADLTSGFSDLGAGPETQTSVGSGDTFGLQFGSEEGFVLLFFDDAYAGEMISGSFTLTDAGLCSLGFDLASQVLEFGDGGSTERVILEFIPSSLLPPNPPPPRADAAYSVRECDQMLVQIDLATAAVSEVGPTGGDDIDALAFSPTNVLYGVDNDEDVLVTIDINTGARTVVGSFSGAATDVQTTGLAFDSSGILYLVERDARVESDILQKLFTVNPASAALTLVSDLPEATGSTSLAFDRNDALFSVWDIPDDLVTLSVSGGPATVIGDLGLSLDADESQGLTVAIDGRLYMVDEESEALYRLNTNSGAASLIGDLDDGYESLAAPPASLIESLARRGSGLIPVPGLPGPWLILLMGLAGVLGVIGIKARAAN